MIRLAQWRCRLLGGHLPITQYTAGTVQPTCYLCAAKLGPGWAGMGGDLVLPTVRPLKGQVQRPSRTVVEWTARYDRSA